MKTTNLNELRFNAFSEQFSSLDTCEKVSLLNDYLENNKDESLIYPFDEDFFSTFFASPAEAARATYFGDIRNWADEWIYFNGYGNLVSLADYQADDRANDYIREIYERDNFSDYIDLSDFDGEDDE